MDCQIGSRRPATWDEVEDAPQVKRLCEEKVREDSGNRETSQQKVPSQQPAAAAAAQENAPAKVEQPKFFISSPIQGYTATKEGCRYLFF